MAIKFKVFYIGKINHIIKVILIIMINLMEKDFIIGEEQMKNMKVNGMMGK